MHLLAITLEIFGRKEWRVGTRTAPNVQTDVRLWGRGVLMVCLRGGSKNSHFHGNHK